MNPTWVVVFFADGDLHQDCRKMLSDLISFSFTQQHSIYAQDNLFPSNQMLIDWDKTPYTVRKIGLSYVLDLKFVTLKSYVVVSTF